MKSDEAVIKDMQKDLKNLEAEIKKLELEAQEKRRILVLMKATTYMAQHDHDRTHIELDYNKWAITARGSTNSQYEIYGIGPTVADAYASAWDKENANKDL